MPTNSHIESTTQGDGEIIEKLSIEFSNGSLQQLRELGEFFEIKSDDPAEVVKLAISFLQNIKDRNGTQKKDAE